MDDQRHDKTVTGNLASKLRGYPSNQRFIGFPHFHENTH